MIPYTCNINEGKTIFTVLPGIFYLNPASAIFLRLKILNIFDVEKIMNYQKQKQQANMRGRREKGSGADCTDEMRFALLVSGPWEEDVGNPLAVSLGI